jgi:hypothetical protein
MYLNVDEGEGVSESHAGDSKEGLGVEQDTDAPLEYLVGMRNHLADFGSFNSRVNEAILDLADLISKRIKELNGDEEV